MVIQWPQNENRTKGNKTAKLFEAHNKVQQQQQAKTRSNRPHTGTVRLSNTDTLRTALAIRQRLLSKLAEVSSVVDVDRRTRDAMVATVKMQLDRVDQKIADIRRRERAVEEERRARRDQESESTRRQRRRDMQERSIRIRRDFLYPADQGGFNPHNPLGFPGFTPPPPPAVSIDIGGSVSMAMDAPMPPPAMDVAL